MSNMNRRPPVPTAAQLALKPGDWVVVELDDGSNYNDVVRSEPWKLGGGVWVVMLEGRAGGYALHRCTPSPKPSATDAAAPGPKDAIAVTDAMLAAAGVPERTPGPHRHMFAHLCHDGTELSLTVDLGGDDIGMETNFKASARPDLEEEFFAWSDSVAREIVPMLTRDQMRRYAVAGMRRIAKENQ